MAAREAVKREFDLIISAGGDGTLYEVINGMAEQEYRPQLGILPLGTTNDFARLLPSRKNVDAACDLIIKQYSRPIDVGKVNQRYFINIAGGGSMTELTYEVPSKLKTMLGQLAYYMKGLEKLPRLRPIEIYARSKGIDIHEKSDAVPRHQLQLRRRLREARSGCQPQRRPAGCFNPEAVLLA